MPERIVVEIPDSVERLTDDPFYKRIVDADKKLLTAQKLLARGGERDGEAYRHLDTARNAIHAARNAHISTYATEE